MRDLARLLLRIVAGTLLFGHGTQKLFGWFGGHGLKGTSMWLESLGFRPSDRWAWLAGAGEAVPGALTALGFLSPLGPIGIFGPMVMATTTVHKDKPIWATEGGPELAVVYMTMAGALAMVGPGRYSLDHTLGIRVPGPIVALAVLGTLGATAYGAFAQQPPSEEAQEVAGEELQGGVGASAPHTQV